MIPKAKYDTNVVAVASPGSTKSGSPVTVRCPVTHMMVGCTCYSKQNNRAKNEGCDAAYIKNDMCHAMSKSGKEFIARAICLLMTPVDAVNLLPDAPINLKMVKSTGKSIDLNWAPPA
jgi:hypothetical protein